MNTNPDGLPDYIDCGELSDTETPPEILRVTALSQPIFTDEQFYAALLVTAKGYLGVSRANNLPQVAKFLALFGLPTKIQGKWVAFCAAGIAYSAAKTYCELSLTPFTDANSVEVFRSVLPLIKARFFLPSTSCGAMKSNAQARGTWVEKGTMAPQKDWFALYNWHGNSAPEHIEIIEAATLELHTLGFNTTSVSESNGGVVAERQRSYDCVVGYIRPLR